MARKLMFTLRFNLECHEYFFDAMVPWPDTEFMALMGNSQSRAALAKLSPEKYKELESIRLLLNGLPLRLRYNSDIRGPFVVDLDDELDEDDLLRYINKLPIDALNRWLKKAYTKIGGGRP